VSVRRGAVAVPHLDADDSIALDEARPVQPRPAAKATGPGVSSAGALAHMSSHPPARSRG
jgi:glucokinase